MNFTDQKIRILSILLSRYDIEDTGRNQFLIHSTPDLILRHLICSFIHILHKQNVTATEY